MVFPCQSARLIPCMTHSSIYFRNHRNWFELAGLPTPWHIQSKYLTDMWRERESDQVAAMSLCCERIVGRWSDSSTCLGAHMTSSLWHTLLSGPSIHFLKNPRQTRHLLICMCVCVCYPTWLTCPGLFVCITSFACVCACKPVGSHGFMRRPRLIGSDLISSQLADVEQ